MFTSPSSAGRSWTHKLLAAAARFQTEKSVAWQRQQNFCDDGWCLEPGLARRLLTHSYLEQRGEIRLMVSEQQYFFNKKNLPIWFQLLQGNASVPCFSFPPAFYDSPVSFFHPQELDLPESSVQTPAGDKLSPVRNSQALPPVQFLHLKITLH